MQKMIKKTVLEQLILCVQSNDAGELLFSKQGDYTLIKKRKWKRNSSVVSSIAGRLVTLLLLPRFRSTCCSIFVVLLVFWPFRKAVQAVLFCQSNQIFVKCQNFANFENRSKNKFFFHHLVRFCIFFNGLLLLSVLSLTLVYIFAAQMLVTYLNTQ